MALPTSRNTTYVNGLSQVDANDLNDIQDKIVDLNTQVGSLDSRVNGEREIWIDAASMTSGGSAATLGMAATTGVVSWTFAVGNRVAGGIPGLRQGERIKAFKARADSTPSAGTLEIRLWKQTSTAAPVQVGSTLTHSNTPSDQTHTLASPETVDAGEQFRLVVNATAGAPVLHGLCVVVDRGA